MSADRVPVLLAEGSCFHRLDDGGPAETVASESGEIPMIGASTNVIATFLDRPGLKALDLLGAWVIPDGAARFPPRAKPFPIR